MPTVTEICRFYSKLQPSKTPKIWKTINEILIEDGYVNVICQTGNILTEIVRAARNAYITPVELLIVMNRAHVNKPETKTLYINCIGTFRKTVNLLYAQCIVHEKCLASTE